MNKNVCKLFLSLGLCLTLLAGCGDGGRADAGDSGLQTERSRNSNGSTDVELFEDAFYSYTGDLDHSELAERAAGDVIEIREKLFVAQTNDIYLNAEDYLGKTLKYEGIFTGYTDEETGETYYSVIRYGPGCCGFDLNAGFEIDCDEDRLPQEDDWVEITGVLEAYEEDGFYYLRVAANDIQVLDERGAEYVFQ